MDINKKYRKAAEKYFTYKILCNMPEILSNKKRYWRCVKKTEKYHKKYVYYLLKMFDKEMKKNYYTKGE